MIIKEQSEKIAEFDKTIKDLEEKLEQERAENAVQKIKADINKDKYNSIRKHERLKRGKVLINEGLNDLKSIFKDTQKLQFALIPEKQAEIQIEQDKKIIKALSKIGRGLIFQGFATIENVFEKIKEYIGDKTTNIDNIDSYKSQIIAELQENNLTDVSDDKFKIPHSLIREIVKNGTEDIDGIVQKVLEVYHDIYPDLDERKVRDIITKYLLACYICV